MLFPTIDFAVWARTLAQRPSAFPWLVEKAMQGVMNHLALQRMMTGRFLREADPRITIHYHSAEQQLCSTT